MRKSRSQCPLNRVVEFLGDRWSLLILRDIFFFGERSFGQLLGMEEKISTGALSSRISKLEEEGILSRRQRCCDKRSVGYTLTDKGLKLEPVLVEMVLWAAENDMKDVPKDALENLRRTRSLCRSRPQDTE